MYNCCQVHSTCFFIKSNTICRKVEKGDKKINGHKDRLIYAGINIVILNSLLSYVHSSSPL